MHRYFSHMLQFPHLKLILGKWMRFQLMQQLNKAEQKGIAVALHQKVIPKERWDRTNLKEEDKITIITATQGG